MSRLIFHAFVRAVALCLGCVVGFNAPASAQQKASVAGSEMRGHGRLVFTFEQPVRAQARSANGILVISLDSAVAIDLDKVSTQAAGYISVARRDPDGRTLRFALTRPFRANLMEAGEKVFVDLLPESWQGLPPGLPQDVVEDLARRARDAEERIRRAQTERERKQPRDLTARVGQGPTFTRLMLELNSTVAAELDRVNDRLSIGIDAPLRFDPAKIKAQLPSSVQSIETETIAGSLKVHITVASGTEMRAFREDDTIVVDFPLPAQPLARVEQSAADVPRAAAAPVAPATAQPATPAARAAPQPTRPAEPAAIVSRPVQAVADARPIRPTFDTAEATTTLTIPFRGPTPAAAYNRADILWLVFDSAEAVEKPELPPAILDKVRHVDLDRVAGAVVLRLHLARPAPFSLAPDGRGWVATIGDGRLAATDALPVRRGVSSDGKSVLTAPMRNAGQLFWLDDPESGARLGIVTASGTPLGVPKGYDYVEVAVLPSAHGLVVSPKADDVTVRVGLDEVLISRDRGLTISLGVADATSQPANARDLLLETDHWRTDVRGNVLLRQREFLQAAADAPKRSQTEARLRLARFQVANGLYHEATGVLNVIADQDPAAAAHKSIAMLRVAAATLQDDLKLAARLLNEPALQLDAETVLWRAVVDAKAKRWTPALVGFRQSLDVLDRYPDRLQAILRDLAVEVAIEGQEPSFAAQQLDLVERLQGPERDAGRVTLQRGRIAELTGRLDEAKTAYDAAARSSSRPVEARARLYRTLLALSLGRVETAKAVEELETIGMIWRRDEVEVRALAKLGELYSAGGRWREAFSAARRANEILPDHPLTRSLHDEMAVRFEELFLEGKADNLPKLEALGLFYDFRNLTPISRRGDEMIRRLADRLADLDLLDQATELLQHQVDNRLGGVARATVATRLAVLYMMNRKPVDALKALRVTRSPTLPAELRRARALLEARGLSELSRTDLALEVLAAQDGPDVERLKADVLWRGKRWRDAGEAIEKVLGDRWQGSAPLSETERQEVLRAGVSYVLAGERLSLDRLRQKFAGKMSNSNDSQAFTLVTSENLSRPAEFRDIARAVVSGDTMTEFLNAYRKRYPDIAASPRPPAAGEQPLPPPLPGAAAPAEAVGQQSAAPSVPPG